MSVASSMQARDDTHKVYATVQGWSGSSANIRLPDSINTKRPTLSNKQIASRYLKSVEGNPNIDINKNRDATDQQHVDQQLKETKHAYSQESMKRIEACDIARVEQSKSTYPPKIDLGKRTNCRDFYFNEYKDYCDRFESINVDYVGSDRPECVCINQLPQFIVASDDLPLSVMQNMRLSKNNVLLDYRNLTISKPFRENCLNGSFYADCPEPENTPDEINRQIDDYLSKGHPADIYLNQTQLNDYLKWREQNGTSEKLSFIRVTPREKSDIKPLLFGLIGGLSVMTATAVALVTRKCVSETKVTQDTATSTSIPDGKSASELDSGDESCSRGRREPSTQENLSNRTEEKIRNGNVTYAESVSPDGQMSGSSQ